MSDALQLLHDSLPFVILALLFAAFWRLTNATVTVHWAAKTSEPERDMTKQRMNLELRQAIHDRDEARRIAEEMRGAAGIR